MMTERSVCSKDFFEFLGRSLSVKVFMSLVWLRVACVRFARLDSDRLAKDFVLRRVERNFPLAVEDCLSISWGKGILEASGFRRIEVSVLRGRPWEWLRSVLGVHAIWDWWGAIDDRVIRPSSVRWKDSREVLESWECIVYQYRLLVVGLSV
jgi:hypothetical protein